MPCSGGVTLSISVALSLSDIGSTSSSSSFDYYSTTTIASDIVSHFFFFVRLNDEKPFSDASAAEMCQSKANHMVLPQHEE